MKKEILSFCCVFGIGITTLFAQQGAIAAGGDASGPGGTVSFSIGQACYTSASGSANSLNEGIQQPYEISVTGIDENAEAIILTAIVYPSPATDKFTLKIKTPDLQNLSYGLYDATGRLISQSKIESEETMIEASQLAVAHYFLTVFDTNRIIKTFQIIKTY